MHRDDGAQTTQECADDSPAGRSITRGDAEVMLPQDVGKATIA